MKKTSEKNGGWKYAKVILQNWLKAGITTYAQVQAQEQNFKKPKKFEFEKKQESDLDKLYDN